MPIELSKRDLALVLVGLRLWQAYMEVELPDEYEAFFDGAEPPTAAELDDLCRRLASS